MSCYTCGLPVGGVPVEFHERMMKGTYAVPSKIINFKHHSLNQFPLCVRGVWLVVWSANRCTVVRNRFLLAKNVVFEPTDI